ncbi:transglutaminase domain-containing protein [Bradyrhizobium sp. LHD-71]|uniref:transglutaminase domain-containing protein n=1 Tax=Bradyrhizobium sp. LHD-71 TaxID=3072141 RepID=UPI00280FB931|nr:transglutaminase domain-containing protein [Bradyrhizobium sp. LHD-71]MDQ8726279.1 transglutaminase domain-containing protein [Bradyrhizobium sp. LHD-71]
MTPDGSLPDRERWLRQTAMTDPGSGASSLDGLPDDIAGLCRVVQGALIHTSWISAYDLTQSDLASASRQTLPLSDRLRRLAATASEPLGRQRSPKARLPGTCRDFAVMLCGLLRHKGILARVRCGFAAYFYERRWEDHWICQAWMPRERRWRRIDAQLDDVLTKHLQIDFDVTDIAEDMFISAGEAWRRCRLGQDDPNMFGHGTIGGLWFVRVNVIRDHYALNGAEVSDWDTWRDAVARHQQLSDDEQREADAIAAHPAQPLRRGIPPWIAS